MATPEQIAARVQNDIAGLQVYTDLTGTTGEEVIQALIDIVEPQHGKDNDHDLRGHMDQMSPAAHRQLLAELYAIKDAISTWAAP
jgi:hypothetical protein